MTCADVGRLDLVLRAVERRFAGRGEIVFLEPVTTRALPTGSGRVISRNEFAARERDGTIQLAWYDERRAIGYQRDLIDRLAGGVHVVVGAVPELATAARSVWPDTHIVRLEPGTERLRAALSPRACLSRITRASTRTGSLGRLLEEPGAARVCDSGDLATVVRTLGAAIERSLPETVRHVGPQRAARPPLGRGAWRVHTDKPQAGAVISA